MLSTTVALKGQSRSVYCAAKLPNTAKLCRRLAGHLGDHRDSLKAVVATKPARRAKARKAAKPLMDRTFEVGGKLYHVVVDANGKVTSTEVPKDIESPAPLDFVEKGVEVSSADRYEVQPEPKVRKAKATKAGPKVRNIRMDRRRSRRMVADSTNGAHRTARRARRAPAGRNDQTIAEFLSA